MAVAAVVEGGSKEAKMRAPQLPNAIPQSSHGKLNAHGGRFFALFVLVTALALSGCPRPDDTIEDDSGVADVDAGEVVDAGPAVEPEAEPDAEPSVEPGAEPGAEPDGGEPDAGPEDAGSTGDDDGGSTPTDGGLPNDAGIVEPECVEVSDCSLGFLCVDAQCVPGCEDDRDCPAERYCAADVGDNGTCQDCTDASHCAEGQVCAEGTCRDGCSEAEPGCPGLQICDIPNAVCVRCLEDANCELGNICEAQECIPGCRSNRDCPDAEVCIDDVCQQGCTAAPDDSCPAGTHCGPEATCIVGCNGDDGQCGANQICEGNTCVEVCISSDECGANEVCFDNECVAGCASQDDCDTGVCDAETGEIGACRECLVDDDCPVLFGTAVCVQDLQVCRTACTDNGFCLGAVCDTTTDLCVECLSDDDCNGDNECDLVQQACVPRDLPAAPYCGPCDGDDDCTDGLCVNLPAGNFGQTERVCGQNCGTLGECPQGTSCQFVEENGVVVAQQCVPESSAQGVTSCTAYRNTVDGTACSFTQACGPEGAPFNGVCVLEGGTGICTMACNVSDDCPSDFACTGSPVIGSPPGSAGVCEPVAP